MLKLTQNEINEYIKTYTETKKARDFLGTTLNRVQIVVEELGEKYREIFGSDDDVDWDEWYCEDIEVDGPEWKICLDSQFDPTDVELGLTLHDLADPERKIEEWKEQKRQLDEKKKLEKEKQKARREKNKDIDKKVQEYRKQLLKEIK